MAGLLLWKGNVLRFDLKESREGFNLPSALQPEETKANKK